MYQTAPKIFLFFFFFLSCYSSSLDLESTVATPNEFFSFKKSNNSIKNDSFSLIDSNVSHNQKQKAKSISYYNSKVESEQENKKKKERKEKKKFKPIWPNLAIGRRNSDGGEVTRRCCLVNADLCRLCPSSDTWSPPAFSLSLSLCCVPSPSLSLSPIFYDVIMCNCEVNRITCLKFYFIFDKKNCWSWVIN